MIYKSYKPSIPLLPYIDRYWYCCSDSKEGVDLFPLFAGTGVDLFIHFGTPFLVDNTLLPSSHIFCQRRTTAITSKHQLNFLAVRFRSGAFRHFCSINFNELNNETISTQELWGYESQELTEQLHEEPSMPLRVQRLNDFFLKQLNIYHKDTQRLDKYISYIYENYDDVMIYSLATESDMSLRHFERLFKNEFGISPKKFQIISRFQSTIKALLLSSHDDYLPIVLNNGYYDQPHFIKECRLFTNLSPIDILEMRSEKSHFYFETLTLNR